MVKEERSLINDLGEHLGRMIKQKHAEEALEKNRALLAEAQEAAKLGGFDFDVKTMAQRWTEEIRKEKCHNYSIHECPGLHVIHGYSTNQSPSVVKSTSSYVFRIKDWLPVWS